MGERIQPTESAELRESFLPLDQRQKAVVLRELENIQKSQVFRTSKRCKQFLSYVVEHSVEGHAEFLKERSLGVELFQRPLAYSTGDDPVVRVKASDVRKRLVQYYATEAQSPEVRIDIPVGSYIPEFHWNPGPAVGPIPQNQGVPTVSRFRLLPIALTALALIAVGVLIFSGYKRIRPPSVVDQFWAPLFRSPGPVLICLSSAVVYEPSMVLYKRYARTHPEKYQTLAERLGGALELDPNDTLRWKDMTPNADLYVWKYDSFVAGQMSVIFDRIGKPSQVRSLSSLSFEDLRNSPAVLIGAFNNRWTLQMAANLPFFFEEEDGIQTIREHAAKGRIWQPQRNSDGVLTVDYALVSRIFDSKTGQPLIIAAGIDPAGTEAAGEFLSYQDYLTNVLRSAPLGWQKMNFQAVLQSDVTDGVASPSKVVATRFW